MEGRGMGEGKGVGKGEGKVEGREEERGGRELQCFEQHAQYEFSGTILQGFAAQVSNSKSHSYIYRK